MQKLLHSGTIADKISALSISIKENPDHALGSLNKLLEIVQLFIICIGWITFKREKLKGFILT